MLHNMNLHKTNISDDIQKYTSIYSPQLPLQIWFSEYIYQRSEFSVLFSYSTPTVMWILGIAQEIPSPRLSHCEAHMPGYDKTQSLCTKIMYGFGTQQLYLFQVPVAY